MFLDGARNTWDGGTCCAPHTIEDLALPVPPAASAVLRVLVALTARVTELDNPTMRAGEWPPSAAYSCKQPDGFDPDRVHAYFDRYIWDLY
ncbi:type I-E CRISPR-associated protein Cse1/CasA, partial [Streptomyces sp. LBUM 1478]|nr:type I-E CRISPR-associated protein Cse1/CasA [Streptomyces sp. LBUM 1478]